MYEADLNELYIKIDFYTNFLSFVNDLEKRILLK